MAIFKGAGVAVVTPMYEDGSVNFDKLEELVEFHIANGTDSIIACGTTGESATLPIEEHLKVVKRCIEVANKRIPIIAGAGSNSTASAIYTSVESEKMGADGLLWVTPYYNKATQNGLIKHYTTLAESVKIPAILLFKIRGNFSVKRFVLARFGHGKIKCPISVQGIFHGGVLSFCDFSEFQYTIERIKKQSLFQKSLSL